MLWYSTIHAFLFWMGEVHDESPFAWCLQYYLVWKWTCYTLPSSTLLDFLGYVLVNYLCVVTGRVHIPLDDFSSEIRGQ